MINQNARVAIVTGGRGGLGAAIVRRLSADGFRVACADIDAAGPAEPGTGTVGVFHCTRACLPPMIFQG
jgi:NAD(P)-dependent dehydrogenase (short-subunit alcohol dehydrogenase family)